MVPQRPAGQGFVRLVPDDRVVENVGLGRDGRIGLAGEEIGGGQLISLNVEQQKVIPADPHQCIGPRSLNNIGRADEEPVL